MQRLKFPWELLQAATEAEQSTELLSGMMRSALLHGRPPVDIDKTVIEPPEKDEGKEVDDGAEA